MKVKITPTGESAQVMEFNVSLPCGANASIAPVSTESTSTIMETAATSETITTLTPTVTKVIDVIIPNGVSQQVLDELPTSLPVKGHCAYSVFDVRVTPAPAPTAAIASVAKSK